MKVIAMRLFLSQRIPEFQRVVVVESGSRALLELLLPGIYENHPHAQIDIVTCYAGQPDAFNPLGGVIYRIGEYAGADGRARLLAELRKNRYSVTGMICSGEPIMTKWKWMLALRLPGKLFLLNENGDYVWFDRGQWKVLLHFMLFRADLVGAGAVRTVARFLFLPFTLIYLLAFAGAVHLQRKVRS